MFIFHTFALKGSSAFQGTVSKMHIPYAPSYIWVQQGMYHQLNHDTLHYGFDLTESIL